MCDCDGIGGPVRLFQSLEYSQRLAGKGLMDLILIELCNFQLDCPSVYVSPSPFAPVILTAPTGPGCVVTDRPRMYGPSISPTLTYRCTSYCRPPLYGVIVLNLTNS